MLNKENTCLVVVDVQGKLATMMDNHEQLFSQLQSMVKGVTLLGLPILWVEQLPDKLGPTIPELAELMPDNAPMAKNTFSCWQNAEFRQKLIATECQQILVVGIESHICVYQTAMEMHQAGFDVEVVSDCVSSRKSENKQIALSKMQQAGIGLTSVEMALFELQKVAEGATFKSLLSVIK